MDNVFKIWQESLSALHASIGKDLAEIHRCKAEVERLRKDVVDNAFAGKMIRDDNRLILSAPEIIIGNVSKNGVLREGGSTVVIRGNILSFEGAENGVVTTRASVIRNIAEEPGIDGREHYIGSNSKVISMGRNVVINASDAEGTFVEMPEPIESGVQIHSDTQLVIDASATNEKRAAAIENTMTQLNDDKSRQKKRMDEFEALTKQIMQDINDIFEESEKLSGDVITLRSNSVDFTELRDRLNKQMMALAQASSDYIASMATLAETERQIADLNAAKEKTDNAKDEYKTKATGASLSLVAENISMLSADGDGNIRDNDDSGISMQARKVSVASTQADGQLIKDSSFVVNTENATMDTRSSKLDEKGENGDITTVGTFNVHAKTISMTAVDSEMSSKTVKEKALVKDSSITLRAEKVKGETTDTEGKVTGSIELNTKKLELKAVDVDKESRADKDMAPDSSIVVFAEKMSLGSRDSDKNKSKNIQLTGDNVAVLGKTTAEVQQGDGKAIVQLSGGNLKVSGSATEIYGKTTIQADTEVKGNVKAPKASIDNLEAGSSFKSPNISDGIAVPAAPSSASLSAKLKEQTF